MTYKNLEAEMAREGITHKKMAELLGINITTMHKKMNGKTQFTVNEASQIVNILKGKVQIEHLFSELFIDKGNN